MPAPLATDYALARNAAAALATGDLGLAAVFVGGVGDDWLRTPVYPYAAVAPSEAQNERGGVTRTVHVRLAVRADAAASKPAPTDTPNLFVVGAGEALSALVAAARDALTEAQNLGALLESIGTAYDNESLAPVAAATLTLNFADPQAYGDAF